VRFALWLKSRALTHYFSQGRLLDGAAITFYEALMPALQVIVLLGVASSDHRLRRAISRSRLAPAPSQPPR
jgi:hypothetical protein